jgi:hypothetical protein
MKIVMGAVLPSGMASRAPWTVVKSAVPSGETVRRWASAAGAADLVVKDQESRSGFPSAPGSMVTV